MSYARFRHVILTRFNYGLYDWTGADEWMAHRMHYFERCMESVLSQEGEFTWVLSVDKRTPGKYWHKIAVDKRIFLSKVHVSKAIKYEAHGAPWIITSRLDNDDVYLPGAVKAIQDSFDEREKIVDIKYHQNKDGVLYHSNRPNPNGPFLSLIERYDDIKTCYARPHNKMAQDFSPSVFASDKILAHMVIHDRNIGNRVIGKPV